MLWSASMEAQEAEPIYVVFEFRAAAVSNLYSQTELMDVQRKIGESLAARCAAKLTFWDFQAGTVNDYPRLSVWLDPHGGWAIQMTLSRAAGDSRPAQPWMVTLFPPGEIGERRGYPAADRWPELIKMAFDERMLGEKRDQVFTVLRESVPLGKIVLPIGSPTPGAGSHRALLPLRWDRYGQLAMSKFRIDCNSDQGRVKLHSKGVGQPWLYQGPSSFCGIVVQHLKWQSTGEPEDIGNHLTNLQQLKPFAFYLLEFEDPGELPNCEP